MSGTNVCIVEDHSQVRDSIATLLRAAGFHVSTFQSAEAFLEYCEAAGPQSISCLVLDVRLPGMSGLELTSELTERASDIPIILISGHASRTVAELALERGATALLEKPFDGHQLVEEVSRAISGQAE